MPARPEHETPELGPEFARNSLAWIVGTLTLGGVAGLVLLPRWLPALDASLSGDVPHAPWYVCRASGTVAFALLWLATLSGLTVSTRLARDLAVAPAALDLHQHLTLTSLAFVLVHAGVLLGDRYVGFDALGLALPFASASYRPFAVGLGQVALWWAIPVVASYYLRRDLGRTAWRLLHGSSLVVFLLALVHGALAGTSADAMGQRALYWLAGGSVLLFTFYRALLGAGLVRDGRG